MSVLDNNHPLFVRGFVLGCIWEAAWRDKWVQADVDPASVEMIMRIADAAGLPFAAEPVEGSDWLTVRIGHPENAPRG
jgi:hypothetical protein